MNHNIIYSAIGTFWKLHENSTVFNTIFDGLAAAAVEARLALDQVNDSIAVETCPVYFEKTWLYRKPERWHDTGGFHEHYAQEFVSAGQKVFTYNYPLKEIDIFYNGQKLSNDDDIVTTSTTVTFSYTVPAGAVVKVYGHRILEEPLTSTQATYSGVVNELSIEFRLTVWDITNLTSLTGTILTLKGNTFYKGETLRIVEGALTEDISVITDTTQLTTKNTYTTPTIYRVLDLILPADSVRLIDGNIVEFDSLVPPGVYFRIADALGGQTTTITRRGQRFKVDRVYSSTSYTITILGGTIQDVGNAASTITIATAFNSKVAVTLYAEFMDNHTHVRDQVPITESTTRITITNPVILTRPYKIFVNGTLLEFAAYRWISFTEIEFTDPLTSRPYPVQPDDVVTVFINTNTSTQYHVHVRNEFVVKTSERSFMLTHHGSPLYFPSETFIGGKLTESYFTDENNIITFIQTVDTGHRIFVDIPALDYPYYTEVDDDIDSSYYRDTGTPSSYLFKAEELRSGILTGDSEIWLDQDVVPVDHGFTIQLIAEPAKIKVSSFTLMEELWFKDAYVVEYTVHDVFGMLFDLPKINTVVYKNSVMALMEGMWKGSQDYTIINFANIIFGSEYTLTVDEILTSRSGDAVTTTGGSYTAPADIPFREKPIFGKHHAFSEYFSKVDPGDYLAIFAQNHSDDYVLSNTLDSKDDATITGALTAITQNTQGYYVLTDTSTNFTLGDDGEVWVGDRIYFRHVTGTSTIEYYSIVIEVIGDHTLVVDPATDFMAYYTHASTSTNIYRAYSRKTTRMDSGQHLDQAYNLDPINTALQGVLPFMNVYKLNLQCLLDKELQQRLCGIFLGKITPAFSAPEVYANIDVDQGSLTELSASIIADVIAGTETIAFIDVGDGGDADPISKADTGIRVAPVSSETKIRNRISRLNIDWVKSSTGFKEFIAVVDPGQLNRSFNEIALITNSGKMLSHHVFEPESLNGRAKKYIKTSLLWVIYTWKITGV